MTVEWEICIDSEEKIFIDDEYGNFPCHQQPSSNSEDNRDEEGEEPESGMWLTRSNRNVCHSAIHISNSWSQNPKYCIKFHIFRIVATLLYKYFADDACLRSQQLLSQYYAAESEGIPALHEDMFLILALVLKMDHVQYDISKQPMSCGILDFFTSSHFSIMKMKCSPEEQRIL